MKIFCGVKKFNWEIKQLPKLSRQTDPLRPEEQQRIKQAVLLAIAKQPEQQPITAGNNEKLTKLMRVVIPTLLGLFLLGGTAFASNNAKPGDLLYPIKIATERVRLSLVVSQSSKANLQAEFATERLKELQLISLPNDSKNTKQNQSPRLNATTTGYINLFASSTQPSQGNGQNNNRQGVEQQTKTEAGLEVQNALKALQQAKTNSQNQGNNKNANDFDKKIKNLEQQAIEQNIPISLPHIILPESQDTNKTNTTTPVHIKNEDSDHKNGTSAILNIQNETDANLATSTDSGRSNGNDRHGNNLPKPLLNERD